MILFDGRVTERGEVQKKRSPICWFTLHVANMVRDDPGQSQEPGSPSSSPVEVAGAQALGPVCATFLDASAGSWTGSRATQTQAVL